LAAPAYDLQVLQRWVYRPAQEEVVAQLQTDGSRRVADIACGTGVLADRIERELHSDEVYGVDMSEGPARGRIASLCVRTLGFSTGISEVTRMRSVHIADVLVTARIARFAEHYQLAAPRLRVSFRDCW
jgi:trans-aconitate methyltransferase